MDMFEIVEQHLACQVRGISYNKRFTETEIQQLRKEIENDEIALEIVDTVSEISYGEQSGTETVREQYCELQDYPGDIPENHIENPIYQRLTAIMHEGAKGDIPARRSRDTTLATKYVNDVNEVLKCIPVRNLSELKYVVRASALLAC